jgi:hypothetical protein
VQTPGQGGEGACAAISTGAVAAAAEVEGETAQSRLAAGTAPPAGVEPVAASYGRRQRRPSAKQQAAEEEREAAARQLQQRRAREQRASRRTAAAMGGATADVQASQAEQAAAGPAPPAGVAAGADQAGPQPVPVASTRSASRPAAPASPAKPAARLSSPQKGGVRKRASPLKAANRSPQKAEPGAAARRGLVLGGTAGKGGHDAAAAAVAPGSAGLLQRAARVIKSGVAGGVSRLRPARVAAVAARRGLKTE